MHFHTVSPLKRDSSANPSSRKTSDNHSVNYSSGNRSSGDLRTEKRYKAMTNEQFSQVVEAISNGRYSWACVLILRFVGYNPLHFIPYRTYSRLVKENRLLDPEMEQSASPIPANSTANSMVNSRAMEPTLTLSHASHASSSQRLTHIHDLETLDFLENDLQGGYSPSWFQPTQNLFYAAQSHCLSEAERSAALSTSLLKMGELMSEIL